MNKQPLQALEEFPAEVRARFGVLPNFFCTAACAPGLIQELWGFAKAAYLNSPLPSLFKERLFVHLSRFCEVRYCIVRHVGFLVGQGYPAGDASVLPESVEQAMALLRRPVPDAKRLDHSLRVLEGIVPMAAIPETETELEGILFDVLTLLFIDPRGAERARLAIAHAIGEPKFEMLVAFLAFVRTAHYWTETHPTLSYEDDMLALMQQHPQLARLMLDTSEAEWAHSRQALRRVLEDLRNTSGALRSSEERFRALVMATSDMLFRMSPDWSEMRALDGRGFLSDTTVPDSNWLQLYIPDDEQARVREAVRLAMDSKTMFELEHRVLRKDGTTGWVLSRAVPILHENGEVAEWFGAALDLTARKQAEGALREADRHKDTFLATLGHELRNPLAPLRTGLEIARRSGSTNAPFDRVIGMMDRQLNLLVHLVDDLLDVSRINSGKIQLRREQVSLQKMLTASVEAVRPSIDARRHTLIIGECPDELSIDGDPDRLIQVFSNLLLNAAKYTDDAGIIELRTARDGNEAVISVLDTGIGIPAEDLAGIFDMFSQARSHRGRANGGLGIGLSLVRQLVELHGGSVRAVSPGEGKGSTFVVRLPL